MKEQDTRFVYGVGCFWFGPIQKVAKNPMGLPCCPTCSSLLMELPDEKRWWDGAEAYDKDHPGYLALLRWIYESGKHFYSKDEAQTAYNAAKESPDAAA